MSSRRVEDVLLLIAGVLALLPAAISAQRGGRLNYAYLGIGLGLVTTGVARLLRARRSPRS
jgi:hypothetical protein